MSHQRLDYVAASPEGMKALAAVHSHVAGSGLPSALIELVNLRISQINGCAYCIDMHSRDLLKGGMSVDKLVLVPVWREGGSLFDSRERAALAWAETVTRVSETNIPSDDYHAAIAVFNAHELADLTIAIALMNAYNRISVAFRTTPAATR
jgi:AhpD family alkylhydroperoxidase